MPPGWQSWMNNPHSSNHSKLIFTIFGAWTSEAQPQTVASHPWMTKQHSYMTSQSEGLWNSSYYEWRSRSSIHEFIWWSKFRFSVVTNKIFNAWTMDHKTLLLPNQHPVWKVMIHMWEVMSYDKCWLSIRHLQAGKMTFGIIWHGALLKYHANSTMQSNYHMGKVEHSQYNIIVLQWAVSKIIWWRTAFSSYVVDWKAQWVQFAENYFDTRICNEGSPRPEHLQCSHDYKKLSRGLIS